MTKTLLPEPIAGDRRAVAALFNVSTSTIKRWERAGILPPPVRMTPTGMPLWDLATVREQFARAAERVAA